MSSSITQHPAIAARYGGELSKALATWAGAHEVGIRRPTADRRGALASAETLGRSLAVLKDSLDRKGLTSPATLFAVASAEVAVDFFSGWDPRNAATQLIGQGRSSATADQLRDLNAAYAGVVASLESALNCGDRITPRQVAAAIKDFVPPPASLGDQVRDDISAVVGMIDGFASRLFRR